MNAVELLRTLEAAGSVLSLDSDRLRCELPENAIRFRARLHELRHEVAEILRQRLADAVRGWRLVRCFADPRCAANPEILHREFVAASRIKCGRENFLAELAREGFPLNHNGMVAGLALGSDFLVALEYGRKM